MISDYLRSYNSLDDIPSLRNNVFENANNSDQYWHLTSHQYEPYSWTNRLFVVDEIDNIVKIGTTLNLERAQTGGSGVDCLDHRRSFVSWIPMNSTTSWIYERLTTAVNDMNEQFFQFDLTKLEKLQFTYYSSEEQGCYKQHVDPLCWTTPHNRKLSVVVQLSDPSEYEGGELILYNGQDGNRIKKERGMSVFFPSYTLHECTPVTKGERYALVAWVHGPPFK